MAQTNATTIMKNLVSEKKTKITELRKGMYETASKVINSKAMETELNKHSVKFKWDTNKNYYHNGISDGYISYIYRYNADEIVILTGITLDGSRNNQLDNTPIEIRVYN